MKKLTEQEIKVLSAWAIFGLIVLLLVIFINVKNNKKEKDIIENITAINSNRLIDRNRYYTVNSAITKYYSFLNLKDYENILKILNEKYIKTNNINKENVKNYLPNHDKNLSFKPGVMCVKSVKNGVYAYTIEGYNLAQNTGERLDKIYYQVVLDGNASVFDLMPINEDSYKEACNG